MSYNLQNGFNGEDSSESVVHDIDWCFVRFRLHIPIEAENESVRQDANHDEHVKGFRFSQDYAPIANRTILRCRFQYLKRFRIKQHFLDFDPAHLHSGQGLVSADKLLLLVEGLDDDTDKELNEKHADADH